MKGRDDMPLVSSTELLLKAQREGYAVGAFGAENMEMVQAVVEAAEEMNSPVIIQTTPSTIAHASVDMFRAMVYAVAKNAKVPVVMHLDHGNSYELCKKAIEADYTSVMIDGSKMSYEDNIAISKKVVDIAGPMGIPVEAELGTIGGKEDEHIVSDKDALYTNPAQAKDFVERAGVQSLAVAVGTAHGFYKEEPKLDFDRIKEIRSVVDIPLVLHGASGVPDDSVKKSIQLGICKVNYATELRVAFTDGVKRVMKEAPNVYDPKIYSSAGREEVKKLVKEKMKVCGSAGKV